MNGSLYVYNVIRFKQPSFGMRTNFLMRKTVLKTDIILRNTQKAWSLYVYNHRLLKPNDVIRNIRKVNFSEHLNFLVWTYCNSIFYIEKQYFPTEE